MRIFIGLLLVALIPAAHALAACTIDNQAQIALQVFGGAIVVPVEVNGIAASFILDTGAQRSVVSEAAVQRLGLARDPWVGTTMSGIGGIDRRPNADPRTMALGGVPLVRRTLSHDTSLTVGVIPPIRTGTLTIDGLLGRDYLSSFDLDLDVAAQRLGLFQVRGCGGRFLPWTGAYSAIPISFPSEDAIVVPVVLDGTPLRALLDSGASSSLVGAPGMYRLGLTVAGMGGDLSAPVTGVGSHARMMRRHQFRSLKVGDETIDSPAVWVEPVRLFPIVDMLLGADWLARQRVWVSYATRQVFIATP